MLGAFTKWEPDDARVSRPVLRAAEGEGPSVDSPGYLGFSSFFSS
jgi:hypothetical protein